MSTELLARIQFALTISFHYFYPPLSIGLGVVLVLMEGMYLKTRNPLYATMTRFWIKIFALTFALGVATGIVMEFEFGTNWATYSRFVGDVFGSALAAEGIFAFFLESGFLAVLVFGWNRVTPKMHFFAACMVSLGSMLSAVWIVIANSWQQTPAGFHLVQHGNSVRAEVTDFWQMILNPSTVDRLSHSISGGWLSGAFLVMSVSAWYLLKGKHIDFAKASLRIALFLALFASLFQLFTGHGSASDVAKNQPAKLAAMEAHYDSAAPGNLYLMGLVNEQEKRVEYGISIPGGLSFLISGRFDTPIKGLNEIPVNERPPVQTVFQTYHAMVAIGMALIGLSLLGVFFHFRKNLEQQRWYLKLLVPAVLLPELANELGWYTAEIGRQPWIVYGLLRTSDAFSQTVSANQILSSIVMFSLIYLLLFALFVFLLNEKIQHGPEIPETMPSEYERQKSFLSTMSEGE